MLYILYASSVLLNWFLNQWKKLLLCVLTTALFTCPHKHQKRACKNEFNWVCVCVCARFHEEPSFTYVCACRRLTG